MNMHGPVSGTKAIMQTWFRREADKDDTENCK